MQRLLVRLAPPAALATGVVISQLPSAHDKEQQARTSASPPMPMPVDCRQWDDGVEALVNYQHTSVRELSTKIDSSGGSDGKLHGANWDPQRVRMHDGRRLAYSLDVNGFALLTDAKAHHPNYYDEAAVTGGYYRTCEALLQRATGARHVFAFDHNVRNDAAKARGQRLHGGHRVEGPAALVHNDYSAASAARRLAMLCESASFLKPSVRQALGDKPLLRAELADDVRNGRRRFAFVNVWRPIRAVESKPLGCVDATTVGSDELVSLSVQHAGQPSTGGIYFASHRPQHRWIYYPKMTPDEVLLIKQVRTRA